MSRRAKSAGQRSHRAALRDPAGPPGEGNASSGNRYDRSGESLFRNPFSSGVGAAFYGGTTSSPQCASDGWARTGLEEILSVRAARQVADDHTVSSGWKPLGRAPGRSSARGFRGAQVEIERRLDGSHWLRSAGAICTCAPARTPVRSASPFRAYGTCRTCPESKDETPNTIKPIIPCACPSPFGENHGSGHSICQKPEFLLCVT